MEYVERMSSTSPTRAETDSKVLLAAAAASARHQFGLAAQGEAPDEGDGDEDDREEHAEQPVARRLINPPLAAGPGVGGEMPPVAFFGHGRSLHVTPSI